jgi:hypothetical protein
LQAAFQAVQQQQGAPLHGKASIIAAPVLLLCWVPQLPQTPIQASTSYTLHILLLLLHCTPILAALCN